MTSSTTPDAWQRQVCPSCTRSYKFYCPTCYVVLGAPKNAAVPSIKLPLDVDIWFQDKVRKSTAPHAKVLAPQDVNILPYPLEKEDIRYDREDTVVVYPSYDSETLPEMAPEDLKKLQRLVFIDCPWQKAPVILQDPALAQLRCVKLAKPPRESKFWRYHQAGAGCVSTIEAIELMLEEYVSTMAKADLCLREGSENTQLTDLLYFFNLMSIQIEAHYERDPSQHYKPPMDEAEKERRRKLRSQKEIGLKRKLANRQEMWENMKKALESGEISEKPRNGRCYNCKEPGHESKDCPNKCRYCKQNDHFSGSCPEKRVRQQMQQKQQACVTKAL